MNFKPKAILAALGAAVMFGWAGPGLPQPSADTGSIDVTARLISEFRIGRDQQQFGPFTFDGGAEMIASSRHFGSLSGIAVRPDQKHFIAVTDTGFWVEGVIERDADGRLTGLSGVSMRDITALANGERRSKWETDAESVAFDGDDILVSYEREHRIERYRPTGNGELSLVETIIPPVDLRELRRNRGFEGIAIAPPGSAFPRAIIGVSEKSLDANGNVMAFALRPDRSSFEFSVERTAEFDVTDLSFLPGGDLLTLERRFNVGDGLAIRMRRIRESDIAPGETVSGTVVLEADLLHQIDNMEGMALTLDPDGTPRLTLISDDNHSLLQRNLILEFKMDQSLPAGG